MFWAARDDSNRTSHLTGSLPVNSLPRARSLTEPPGIHMQIRKARPRGTTSTSWDQLISSQGTKVTLSFHILTDPLPPSPGFFLSLIYSTFFAFFFHHCPSSLKVCYFLGIFPLGDRCHIVLMLVTVSESGYFPTLFPNHENLWYSSSPLSMGDMFQDPQGILKSWS